MDIEDYLEATEIADMQLSDAYEKISAQDALIKELVEALKNVEDRFDHAAKLFHNTQEWKTEEQGDQTLEDWVFSPVRAALSKAKAAE